MSKNNLKTRNRISGIERSLQILDVLTDFGRPASAYDIAKTIGAPISTIYSIVDDLTFRGMLTKNSNNLVWLGPRLLRYGLAYEAQMNVLLEASKEMDHLAAHLKETIQICTRDEGKMVVTAMATGNDHFHVASHIGSRTPINWKASGRLLVGHMNESECLRMFQEYSEASPIDIWKLRFSKSRWIAKIIRKAFIINRKFIYICIIITYIILITIITTTIF